jgi:hypothetical protein
MLCLSYSSNYENVLQDIWADFVGHWRQIIYIYTYIHTHTHTQASGAATFRLRLLPKKMAVTVLFVI